MSRETITEAGIVLNTTVLREADLILSILLKVSGKVSAIARGVRRSKKRFMGGIEVFDCGLFELNSTKTELYNISSFSKPQIWTGLRTNLTSFSLASLALEITHIFAAEGAKDSSDFFNPLFLTLKNLSEETDKSTSSSICIYYLLLVLNLSGVDPLENTTEIDPKIKEWLSACRELQKPIVPNDNEIISPSLSYLVRYTEEHIGHALKTKESLGM